MGTAVYFTTSTMTMGLRLYRTDGMTAQPIFEIPRPGSDCPNEPYVGEAYVEANTAYFQIYWRNTAQQYVCQVWKTDTSTNLTDLVYGFPLANALCSGLWTMTGDQYMFVGSSLAKFAGMQMLPALVKDLGNATAMPWMVQVDDKLFFQTRTAVGVDTQIDLWVTDGTDAGTNVVKQLESAFFEFNVFAPIPFLGKLYFGHRKSLWSSDGTFAGTNIVKTLPTSSVVGDGAIGTLAAIDGQLYFLATTDGSGREPWVSDGTATGTKLLRDINAGANASTTTSTNHAHFHAANGQTFFAANDGMIGPTLWATDGTLGGTNTVVMNRPVTTVVGNVGNKLLVHDGFHFYALAL